MRGIMGTSSISLLLLLPPPTSNFNPKKPSFSIKSSNPSLPSNSFTIPNLKTRTFNPHPSHKNTQIWRISAAEEAGVSKQVETVQKIVTSNEDTGVSTTISVLLFIAFVGLTILTIGVIYIAVTDFLTKREREKYEKEESGKKKKNRGGKKGVVRSRVGPKGFGQKPDDDDEDDFDF